MPVRVQHLQACLLATLGQRRGSEPLPHTQSLHPRRSALMLIAQGHLPTPILTPRHARTHTCSLLAETGGPPLIQAFA